MHYELTIKEFGRGALNDKDALIDTIIETFETDKQVKEYIINRYDGTPKNIQKTYLADGKESGFLKYYWNNDRHPLKSWDRVDWVSIFRITEETKK